MENAARGLVSIVAAVLVGALVAPACGGRVEELVEPPIDAGADVEPRDAAPPSSTGRPSRCPASPPIRGIACFRGDVCDYCAAGATTGIRATCPSGVWVLEGRTCPAPVDE